MKMGKSKKSKKSKKSGVKKQLNTIKREIWNHKAYFVKRDINGKLETKVRIKGGLRKEEVVRIYKKNKSFSEDIIKQRLKFVTEIIQPIKKPLPKVATKYQIVASVKVGKKTLSARSFQVTRSTRAKEMKNQAYVNLFSRVSGLLGKETDMDDTEVIKIMEKAGFNRIYYAPITNNAKA